MTTAAARSAPVNRIIAQLESIEHDSGTGVVALSTRNSLRVTSLDKVFFPRPKITKGEVMRYYTRVWKYLQPVLADRPLSLKRFPDGVAGDFFFQQKAPQNPPETVRVESIPLSDGDAQPRIIGGTLGTTLYCTQIGAFECNPWNVRVGSLDHPDFAIIDLDPGDKSPFSRVVEVALWVKEALDSVGIRAAVKTSGASGLHIGIPLPRHTPASAAERIPRVVAESVANAHPRSATTVRPLKARGSSRIYVDFGQNSRGKTVASAYSVRARPVASVSAPLAWAELTPDLDPKSFTVRTLPERLVRTGDLWGAVMRKPNAPRIVTTL